MKNQIPTIATAAKIKPAAKEKRLKTKDHEQRKAIKMLRRVLKDVEWQGDDTGKTCPLCRARKRDGHAVSCQLQEVLDRGDE